MTTNFDRYRNLKEKGKLTPKGGGGAVDTFSNSATKPKLNHKPGQMQLASAYRQEEVAEEVPEEVATRIPEEEWESPGPLGQPPQEREEVPGNRATTAEQRQEATNNLLNHLLSQISPRLTPTSLFDATKQQRYDKFKSRVRFSTSSRDCPHGGGEQRDDREQTTRTESKNSLTSPDQDTFEPVIYPPSTQKSHPPTVVSPSQRSAFKTPRTFKRLPQTHSTPMRNPNSPAIPEPPTSAGSTINHSWNQVGLPIASARHGSPENQNYVHKQATPSSQHHTPRSTPPLRAYTTPSHQGASSPKIGSKDDPIAVQRDRDPARNLPPPGVRAEDTRRLKPNLAVNPKSTPTSKPPPLSFDVSVSVSEYPSRTAGTSSTSMETSSQTTTSKERRDRVMDTRGDDRPPLQQESIHRPPLVEHSRPPIYDALNRQTSGPNLVSRPSLELPPPGSNYSFETPEPIPVATTPLSQKPSSTSSQGMNNSGVSPLDFYRRIAAEKTRQASFAKQHAQPTPTQKASSLGSFTSTPRSVTPQSPIFRRGDYSPVSLPNNRSVVTSRRSASIPMLDQRTVRILYSMDFDQLIEEHIQHQTKDLLLRYSRGTPNRNPDDLALYVRKRPLLEDEAANMEFDVINAETGQPNAMVIYVASMLSDLQTKDIQANLHEFDHVFSEFTLDEDVYATLARPEVTRAQGGGQAAIVVFGHSDTGKTHNMLGIEERAVYDLFESSHGAAPRSVSVQFLELSGTHIVDLLGSQPNAVHISEEAGRFRVEGSTVKIAGNPRELLRILSDGRRHLMRSSGKHADHGYILCQFTVNQKWGVGHLSLLECPGSELVDTNSPSSTFRGLMDRIRMKAEGKIHDHPFRGLNFVTKAMQHILESPKSKISVLATVSPAASSTEETLAVLGALASVAPVHVLKRQPQLRSSPPPFPTPEQENVSPKNKIYPRDELSLPRQWNRDELIEWMARKHLLGDQLPYDIDGRKAMRMTIGQLQETFYGEADRKKADRLHQALRAENDRVARMRVKARMAQERERLSAIQVS